MANVCISFSFDNKKVNGSNYIGKCMQLSFFQQDGSQQKHLKFEISATHTHILVRRPRDAFQEENVNSLVLF